MKSNEEKKEMSVREQIDWLLDRIEKEGKESRKMKVVLALVNRVYAGERF